MGATLLISTNSYNLPDVLCKDTLRGVDWATVDCLVFNSSMDSELDTGLELSRINGLIDKVIYINEKTNPLYYCIFTGMDADIYDNEDYLKDSSVLTFLIESYKETGMTIKSPNSDLDTLAKSIEAISSSNFDSLKKLVSNQFWIKTLNTAVANVDTSLTRSNEANTHVVGVLSEATKMITNLQAGQSNTSLELEKLKNLVSEMERKTRPNAPFIFSTYTVPPTAQKVLYVKAVGTCRYLNSFILSYQNYLKMYQQYSSKVLITLPKLKLHMQRFGDFARLASDTVEIIDLGVSSTYVTYEPKKIVLDAFFNQPNVQIFIIVDLMFGDKLIEGHMVETFYALGGLGDEERFKIKPNRAIYPIIGKKEGILINHINDYYRSNEHTRKTLYYDKCLSGFKRLDSILLKDSR